MAPSKTYNIPGLSCAFAIIANHKMRRRFRQVVAEIVPGVNLFGYTATLAAYRHGQPWLSAILSYLRQNRDLEYAVIRDMPVFSTTPVEATYLAWIDTRSTGIDDAAHFFEEAGV